MSKKNIFIIGFNEFNENELNTIKGAENYNFIPLITEEQIKSEEKPNLQNSLNKARTKLNNFKDPIDGLITFFDFPFTLITFRLVEEYDLNGPSLKSGIKCEHKYWSRRLQQEVMPENIPNFTAVNPFKNNKLEDIELKPPFWLKPVKSYGGQLGFKIKEQKDLDAALNQLRQNINYFADPFNYILSFIDLPEEISHIDGNYCIAEELIGGHQCTLSGYVHNNKAHAYGVVDSVNYPNTHSFFYYLLPSELPEDVQKRMAEIGKKVMEYIGFNNSTFNIEFYYNEENDEIKLLEINPRMSQSHSDLYAKVTGHSNHQVLVDLAQGKVPDFKHEKGPFNYAAKFHHRHFHDGIVKHFPDEKELEKIKKEYPYTYVIPHVKTGERLSDIPYQDSYSYRDVIIYTGAGSKKELMKKYQDILDKMDIQIEKINNHEVH